MRPCAIWKEQCEAARQIEAEFGTQNALDYLIGDRRLVSMSRGPGDLPFTTGVGAVVPRC